MEFKTHTENYTSGMNIVIDCAVSDVELVKGNSGEVVFEYCESKKFNVEISNENNAIKFRQKEKIFTWFGNWFLKKNTVKVILPADFNGNLTLKTTTGELKADLNSLDVKNLTISVTTGKIYISSASVSGDIRINATTGNINVENTKAEGNFHGELTTGKCDYEIDCKNIELTSTTGKITFEIKNADEINLKSTTGDIDGTIYGDQGDFSIDYHTTTGTSNLPRTKDGKKKLYAHTTTGDIDVQFKN